MVLFFLSDNVSKEVNFTPRFVPSIDLGWIKEPAPWGKNIVETHPYKGRDVVH
jgi:hypothetical protein